MSQTITVEGMSCEHCEQTVEDALEDVAGVESVDVDRDAEQATVEGDAETADLVSAVNDAGYDATA
ncbi:CopZ family metallochaperone [Natrinema amylolyticum]|uniref:CopZ family metallochaperone n=1 Tax=Natrinema amylolyticum TaxID=2878679 RepID=UPI001CFC32A1|nr:heavy metal-associated domain-containing protein [Natrinema amylolyticum]